MKKDESPDIIVITYNNPFGDYKSGTIIKAFGVNVMFLFNTFNPTGKDKDKSPKNVHEDDPHWKIVLKYKDTLKKLIVFGGKIESGTFKIFEFVCKAFAHRKEVLFFCLCRHDVEVKKLLLEKAFDVSIPSIQYASFEDANTKCNEYPQLEAYMLQFAREMSGQTA